MSNATRDEFRSLQAHLDSAWQGFRHAPKYDTAYLQRADTALQQAQRRYFDFLASLSEEDCERLMNP